MTKEKKIDFINEINEFFINARNHGNGNNWWYPVENSIAYNVKMNHFGDVKSFRKHLTKLQNENMTDDEIYEIMQDDLENAARMLQEDIKEDSGLDCHFAGRSGGWIEVQYINNIYEDFEDYEKEDFDAVYKEAQELQELENKVRNFIEDSHKAQNNYVDSKEYYKDIIGSLLDCGVIKEDKEIKHDKKMNSTLAELLNSSNETVKRHAKGIEKII